MKLLMEAFMNAAEVLDSAIVALVDTPINDDSSLFDRSLFGKHPIEYDVVWRSLVGFIDGNPSIEHGGRQCALCHVQMAFGGEKTAGCLSGL